MFTYIRCKIFKNLGLNWLTKIYTFLQAYNGAIIAVPSTVLSISGQPLYVSCGNNDCKKKWNPVGLCYNNMTYGCMYFYWSLATQAIFAIFECLIIGDRGLRRRSMSVWWILPALFRQRATVWWQPGYLAITIRRSQQENIRNETFWSWTFLYRRMHVVWLG